MTNMMSLEEFQVVEVYKDRGINIPKRATKYSAGYDLESAEDIIIPSIFKQLKTWEVDRIDMSDNLHMMWKSIGYFEKQHDTSEPKSITEIKQIVKDLNLVTMVPTGLKICMESDKYLAIHPRSSMGVNCLLMLANQTGIVDADYYNNEDNEGHIFVPMINLSPYDIKINKGDRIAQGIVQRYTCLDYNENDYIDEDRDGGCGSTGVNIYKHKLSDAITIKIDRPKSDVQIPDPLPPADQIKEIYGIRKEEEQESEIGKLAGIEPIGGVHNPDNYIGLPKTIISTPPTPIPTFKDTPLTEKVTVDHLYRPEHVTYKVDTTVPPNKNLSELAQISTKDYDDHKTIVTAYNDNNE